MIRILFTLFLAVPYFAHADQGPLPAFYDVIDVADNDVLNIRADASSSAAIVGALSPDETRVQVTERSPDGRWGRVVGDPSDGWVFLRYMARQPGQDGRALPTPITCYGTEPFWSFDLGDTEGELKIFSEDVWRLYEIYAARSSNLVTTYGISAKSSRQYVHAIITRRACSDGMSDRIFGLEIDLMLYYPDQGIRVLSGCCRLK